MTKEPEITKKDEIKINKTEQNAAKNVKKSVPVALILSIIALLIALGSIVCLFVLFHNQQKNGPALQQQLQQLVAKQSQAQTQITQLTSELTTAQNTLQQQNQTLTQAQQSINQALATTSQNNKLWVLAQSAHLYRLANFSLSYQHDVDAAQALLQSVKQQLLSSNDPSLLNLQQTVANDILTLQAVPKINISDLVTRLTAISNQINQLPIGINQFIPNNSSEINAVEKTSSMKWYDYLKEKLKQSWHMISQFIVIRHHTQPVEPLISPQAQTLAIENIRMLITQAQWAVLHNEQTLYNLSLTQAQQWVTQYFVANSKSTQAVITELSTLQKINVAPKLPDFSATINTINDLLNAASKTTSNSSSSSSQTPINNNGVNL